MNENHRKLAKITSDKLKVVTGRGPSNIQIKETKEFYEIHFEINLGVLGKFVLKRDPNGLEYLTHLHKRVYDSFSADLEKKYNENLPVPIKMKDFKFDIITNKYVFMLEKL